jgi:hypothetical protein
MNTYDLVDDFGRHTKFDGELLVDDTTDTEARRKPQWTDTEIYRTEGGRYIVWSETHYRIRHLTESCRRASGYDLVVARPGDTWACPHCNPDDVPGGYGHESRVKVDVCQDPAELIAAMSSVNQKTGLRSHSQYSQALLARVSDADADVRASWMEQVVR